MGSPEHYGCLGLQPWDLWHSWAMHPDLAAAIKYIARWKKKGGVEDLKKAISHMEHFRSTVGKRNEYITVDEAANGFGASKKEADAIRSINELCFEIGEIDVNVAKVVEILLDIIEENKGSR